MDEEFLDDYEKELLEGYEIHGIKHDGKSQEEIATSLNKKIPQKPYQKKKLQPSFAILR